MSRIISPNNSSVSISLGSIVSANITTMRDGLVANIMQSYRGLYFRERILCGPPLSCMSDVPPHVKVIGGYTFERGYFADCLSHACPTSPLMSKLLGVILSREDT